MRSIRLCALLAEHSPTTLWVTKEALRRARRGPRGRRPDPLAYGSDGLPRGTSCRFLWGERPPLNASATPSARRPTSSRVATSEFAEHGYSGARVDVIAERTRTTKRMLYYYFESKAGLYTAVLERAYGEIRERERELDVEGLDPVAAMRRLAELTFDHHESHPDFIRLVMIENIHRAEHLAGSRALGGDAPRRRWTSSAGSSRGAVPRASSARGRRRDVHMMISAFCVFRVANQHTFGTIFDRDLMRRRVARALPPDARRPRGRLPARHGHSLLARGGSPAAGDECRDRGSCSTSARSIPPASRRTARRAGFAVRSWSSRRDVLRRWRQAAGRVGTRGDVIGSAGRVAVGVRVRRPLAPARRRPRGVPFAWRGDRMGVWATAPIAGALAHPDARRGPRLPMRPRPRCCLARRDRLHRADRLVEAPLRARDLPRPHRPGDCASSPSPTPAPRRGQTRLTFERALQRLKGSDPLVEAEGEARVGVRAADGDLEVQVRAGGEAGRADAADAAPARDRGAERRPARAERCA